MISAGPGFGAFASVKVMFPGTPIMAKVQVGYKTPGFIEGKRLDAGWDFQAGVGYT